MKIQKKGSIEYESRNCKDTPFHFDLYQNWSSENARIFSTNSHPEIEIIYTLVGPEPICINNDTYIAEPGDLIVVNSGYIHTGIGNHWTHHALILPNDFLAHLGINLLSFSITPHIRDKEMADLFLDIIREIDLQKPFYEKMARVATERFLLALLRGYGTDRMKSFSKTSSESELKIASKVLSFLNCHFDEDFSIEEIANDIGVSSPHMCRCVKDVSGISIIDHLNIIRCRAAHHYLVNTDKKIGEIATLCGFNGRSYFAKIFRKEFGVLPSEIARTPIVENTKSNNEQTKTEETLC